MDRDIHPAETALFVAAALRGLRLEDTTDGLYRVVKGHGDTAVIVKDRAVFKDIANLCGASGTITLRQAADRDGLVWPVSAESFIDLVKTL